MIHVHRIDLLPQQYPTRERYPFNLEVLQQTTSVALSSPVVCFVGENGSGKSTLLEAITRKCGIHIWEENERPRFEGNRYEEQLYHYIELAWTNGRVPGSFFGSEIFRDFARIVDEWAHDDPGQLEYVGGRSLLTQSHGQSLMSFFRARYRIEGLYLLDEPETALSPGHQVELVRLLREMSQAGHAQFILATHSPILMACPGAQIYSFDHVPLEEIAYEDTEHYRVYRAFMADRSRLLGE